LRPKLPLIGAQRRLRQHDVFVRLGWLIVDCKKEETHNQYNSNRPYTTSRLRRIHLLVERNGDGALCFTHAVGNADAIAVPVQSIISKIVIDSDQSKVNQH
jgi:hypothetical protein